MTYLSASPFLTRTTYIHPVYLVRSVHVRTIMEIGLRLQGIHRVNPSSITLVSHGPLSAHAARLKPHTLPFLSIHSPQSTPPLYLVLPLVAGVSCSLQATSNDGDGAEQQQRGSEEGTFPAPAGPRRAFGGRSSAAQGPGLDGRAGAALGRVGGGDPHPAHPVQAVGRQVPARPAGGAGLRRRHVLLLRRAPPEPAQVQLPRRAAPRHPRAHPRPAHRRQHQGDRCRLRSKLCRLLLCCAGSAVLPYTTSCCTTGTTDATSDGAISAGAGAGYSWCCRRQR